MPQLRGCEAVEVAGLSSASRKVKFSPDQKEVKAAILKGERVLVVGQEVTNFTGKIMSLVLSFTVGNKLYCLLLSLGSLPFANTRVKVGRVNFFTPQKTRWEVFILFCCKTK